jgi:hypothetical protein
MQFDYIRKNSASMLYRKIIAGYRKNHMEYMNYGKMQAL